MKIVYTFCLLIIFVCTSVSSATLPPVPLDDDNGNLAFVKQLMPKLLGRKPKGMLEVQLLADIADLHGREALVLALMELPEFKDHWTALLVDHLKVKRESTGELSASCINDKMLNPLMMEVGAGGGSAGGLAEFIINNDVVSNYSQTFNLYDVIQASINLDSLMPLYRSYLFVLATHPPGAGMRTEEERRAEQGKSFDDIFLNRDKECIACHNSTYSTTGIGDRTHPLYGSLDIALFDRNGGESSQDINSGDYTTNCSACHGANATGTEAAPGILGVSADDIATAIATVPVMGYLDVLSAETLNGIADALVVGPFSGSNLVETVTLNNAFFRTDFAEVDDPASGIGPWGMTTDCASINGTPSDGGIPGFFAGASGNYLSPIEIDAKFISGVNKLDVSVDSLAILDHFGGLDGDLAYAYRVAATITENIWEQLMGERLSIANQYPRNAYQRNLLAYLTEEHFIANDWSLKNVILAITTSKFFNRRAPSQSLASGPYELQAVFEPFVVKEDCRVNYSREDDDDDEPREPIDDITFGSRGSSSGGTTGIQTDLKIISNEPCYYNGQGDIVHRFAPRTLLNSIAKALDWPKPQIKPGNNYPSANLAKAIGQYWSLLETGDKDVGFQSLLNWDDAFGTCPQKGQDWIEKLVAAIDGYNTENPLDPLTLEDVVLTMKDWLIQEPGFGGASTRGTSTFGTWIATKKSVIKSEQDLLEELFGEPLQTPVDSQLSSSKLRELCGVYLKTPQFMLASIVRNDNYTPPKLRVCNSGSCSYKEMCMPVRNQLNILGYDTICNNESVSKPFVFIGNKLSN